MSKVDVDVTVIHFEEPSQLPTHPATRKCASI